MVVVLHDINFAARYADYICAVKDGRLARFGTPDEIMDSAVLTEIFNTDVRVIDGPRGKLAVYF